MPIKRLQDERNSFPRIGILRKGAPKTTKGWGADLEYFRFDTDDERASHMFKEAYGDTPAEIEVFLPYATVNQNFEAWQEHWVQGGMQHRCDGETCTQWLGPDGKYHSDPKPCPGGCKEVGRLQVIIPALKRFAYVTALTHSVHDILTLTENLTAMYSLAGTLQGIPFILKRTPRMISTPSGKGGKRARREKWLLSLEVDPQWAALKLEGMTAQALSTAPLVLQGEQALLTVGDIDSIQDHPDNIYIDEDSDLWEDEPEEEKAKPPVLGDKEFATLRKQFHATGTEAYGKGWDAQRKAFCKFYKVESSNDIDIQTVHILIDGMREKMAKEKA